VADSRTSIRFEVAVPVDQAALLEGLAQWQQLGLLSEAQIRQLCQDYLTCPLPVPQIIAASPSTSDFIPVSAPSQNPQDHHPSNPLPTPTPWFSQRLQALMEEISIIWLLFLGVFLVVVSSGVLAASQWQNFSPTGQYLILLAYTVAFFIATAWTAQRPTLQLTAQMLRTATLLLIPINFWRMDAIALWQNPWGWAIAPLAAILLSFMLVRVLRPAIEPPAQPRWVMAIALALSWLHWGWAIPGMALIASYGATIGSALTLTTQFPPGLPTEAEPTDRSGLSQPVVVLLVSLLVLLVRALWVAQVPVEQLGLALGICGGLLCWQARRSVARRLWAQVGVGLLLLGWGVTAGAEPPLQAIAISLIACALLLDRVAHKHRPKDLVFLFFVGLQTWWLAGQVIPPGTRDGIFAWVAQQVGGEGMPWAALGMSMFPYLLATIWVGSGYQKQNQPQLRRTTDRLALGLGLGLIVLSVANPIMGALTLTLSFVTLVLTLRQRKKWPVWGPYLAQGLGLGAIAAWTDAMFPSLGAVGWSFLILGAALVEWGFCTRGGWFLGQRSAWHLGLGLAALGGLVFWNEGILQPWGWLWLVVPLALTGLGYLPTFPPYRTAIKCSTVAAILVQGFTYEAWESRLLSLGLMTLLLLFNTRRVPIKPHAIIHVGIGVAFAAALFWKLWDWTPIEWPVAMPLIIAMLWGLWHGRSRQGTPLSQVYKPSLTGWAIALSILNFLVLSAYVLYGLTRLEPFESQVMVGFGLWLGAIAYRLWLRPTNLGFLSFAAVVELVLIAVVHGLQPLSLNLTVLGIANLALGLGTQVAGDLWTLRTQQSYRQSWHGIPLLYGAIGFMAGHAQPFSAVTGLYTLAFALVGAGVGRRHPRLRMASYLALVLLTVGLYELLIYHLSQATGGAMGDGIVLLAGLAAVLGVGDRLLNCWLAPYLRLTSSEIRGFALIHWILGSGLLLVALSADRSVLGGGLWIGVAAILAADALWQGRTQNEMTYMGIGTAVAACMYALWLLVPNTELLMAWAGAIATPVACALYLAPWERWGWGDRPWQNSALILPLALVAVFGNWVAIPTLFIVGAFYAWAAKVRRQIRLSYVSILLGNWGMVTWLQDQRITSLLAYASLVGLSLLYLAEVDPDFSQGDTPEAQRQQRQNRHLLRIMAVGLIVLTSVYEAERGLGLAAIALLIALILVLAGLALRVRAYLFVGTIAFIYQILRQLVLLIDTYPLLLWAVGIVLGLLFIWIAANFEARRAQIAEFVRYWLAALEQWE